MLDLRFICIELSLILSCQSNIYIVLIQHRSLGKNTTFFIPPNFIKRNRLQFAIGREKRSPLK